MFHPVTLYMFWPLMHRFLGRERRRGRQPGKQAERRENENSEYRQEESYQSDLNSLITVVVRFIRTFHRNTQIFGLFRSQSRQLNPNLLQM